MGQAIYVHHKQGCRVGLFSIFLKWVFLPPSLVSQVQTIRGRGVNGRALFEVINFTLESKAHVHVTTRSVL